MAIIESSDNGGHSNQLHDYKTAIGKLIKLLEAGAFFHMKRCVRCSVTNVYSQREYEDTGRRGATVKSEHISPPATSALSP